MDVLPLFPSLKHTFSSGERLGNANNRVQGCQERLLPLLVAQLGFVAFKQHGILKVIRALMLLFNEQCFIKLLIWN